MFSSCYWIWAPNPSDPTWISMWRDRNTRRVRQSWQAAFIRAGHEFLHFNMPATSASGRFVWEADTTAKLHNLRHVLAVDKWYCSQISHSKDFFPRRKLLLSLVLSQFTCSQGSREGILRVRVFCRARLAWPCWIY